MKTVLIDYGAGNLHSVYKALEKVGMNPLLTPDPRVAEDADALILPGQGHFRQVMEAFRASGFEPVVREHIANHKPFLGICVGLQLLMDYSEEAPKIEGLGIIKGGVRRFPEGKDSVPQMGWNSLNNVGNPPLLEGLKEGSFVYYANSYYVTFQEDLPGASTYYGGVTFKAAVSKGALNATQFHPEKSQSVGLQVLTNFKRIAQEACGTLA